MYEWDSSLNFFQNIGGFFAFHHFFTAQVLMFLLLAFIGFFFLRYSRSQRPQPGTTEWISMRDRPKMSFLRPGRMEAGDWLPLGIITLIYAVVTFLYLGNLQSPVSPYQFNEENKTVTIELDEPVYIDRVQYFTSLYHSHSHGKESSDCCYILELSENGIDWYKQDDMHQSYAETFRWKTGYIDQDNYPPQTKYLRITLGNSRGPLEMGEFVLYYYDEYNQSVPYPSQKTKTTPEEASALLDEQSFAPERSEVINSTHFDEIYHARTAYEHLTGVYPYEITHPPLGKLTTALGIMLFDMTPFGWRFMPALFGVLMLPLIFILIKWMFDKTLVAACGTILFAFDFMHFTQTRISTIDVYAVFYILAMFLFMYRYFTLPLEAPFRKTALPFFLSGLFFGIGAASKWVCVYAGAGLLILFIITLVRRYRYYRQLYLARIEEEKHPAPVIPFQEEPLETISQNDDPDDSDVAPTDSEDSPDNPVKLSPPLPEPAKSEEKPPRFAPFLLKSIALGLLSFVIVPVLIYTASYIPYALARPTEEMRQAADSGSILSQAVALIKGTADECIRNQKYMFSYHKDLKSEHYYSSRWYQWILDTKGILYFRDSFQVGETEVVNADGTITKEGGTSYTSSLVAFNNPLIAWAGLAALLFCILGVTRRGSHNGLFILIGFAANFLPWLIIQRLTFPYHYFPSLIFLCLALSYIFHRFLERNPFNRRPIYIFTAVAVLLFVLFYPALSGLPAPNWYFEYFLRWLPMSDLFCWPV